MTFNELYKEAMCVGSTAADVFSEEFIERRCSAHGVTCHEYRRKVLDPHFTISC